VAGYSLPPRPSPECACLSLRGLADPVTTACPRTPCPTSETMEQASDHKGKRQWPVLVCSVASARYAYNCLFYHGFALLLDVLPPSRVSVVSNPLLYTAASLSPPMPNATTMTHHHTTTKSREREHRSKATLQPQP
jgi:hypothetical protein